MIFDGFSLAFMCFSVVFDCFQLFFHKFLVDFLLFFTSFLWLFFSLVFDGFWGAGAIENIDFPMVFNRFLRFLGCRWDRKY